jgi:hypothetical protein
MNKRRKDFVAKKIAKNTTSIFAKSIARDKLLVSILALGAEILDRALLS